MSEATEERREQKDRVLEAALTHAAFDGWSRRTLQNAAADCGFDKATATRLFPQGGESLLEWLDEWTDRQMLVRLEGVELDRLPVRKRIARIVRARYEALEPHREAIRRALSARVVPSGLPGGTRSLWRTADLIWDVAGMPGSSAEGVSWYTRRATLAGVLSATTLYWLQDQSEDSAATWTFLDRRIEDVMRIGKLRARMEDFLRAMPGMRPAR